MLSKSKLHAKQALASYCMPISEFYRYYLVSQKKLKKIRPQRDARTHTPSGSIIRNPSLWFICRPGKYYNFLPMDVVNTKERGQAVLDLLRTRPPMRVRETQGPFFDIQNWTVSSTYTCMVSNICSRKARGIDTGPANILRICHTVSSTLYCSCVLLASY